jgi:Uma2 family endonuclease
MENWAANGAQLGWLIDPYRQRVIVYQPGEESRECSALKLDGVGPVQGFSLDLQKVWRCYEVD